MPSEQPPRVSADELAHRRRLVEPLFAALHVERRPAPEPSTATRGGRALAAGLGALVAAALWLAARALWG